MSKNKDIDLDDWALDDDLDLSMDFDPPAPEIPTGRKAIMAMPRTAASSAAKHIIGDGKRKKLILDSLPPDYSVASSAYDTVASEGREVYREARSQIAATKRELQRTAREAMPTVKRYLPESMSKRIDKWANKDNLSSHYGDGGDPRENALLAMMDDTFEKQKQTQEERAQDRVESDIKDAAGNIRQDALNKIISGIRGDTAQMSAYNQVSDRYRKKMLEVNWRQFYVMSDLLQTVQVGLEKLIPNSDAIVKNTALPDYAKEEFGEVTKAMMQRRFIEALSPSRFAEGYAGKLKENLVTGIQSFGSTVRDSIQMASMAIPQQDGMEEPTNLSPAQQRAQMLKTGAGLGGQLLAEKYIAPKVRQGTAYLRKKGEENETVRKFGAKARFAGSNYSAYLNDLAKDPSSKTGFAGFMGSILQTVLPQYNGATAEVSNVTGESLSKVSPWTNRNDITLNEIIPEWLSTINQSIREGAGLGGEKETYDWKIRSFVKDRDVKKTISDKVNDLETKEYITKGIDGLVATLTEGQDVSEDLKASLGKLIDEKIRTVSMFNINDMAENDQSLGKQAMSAQSFELQSLFSNLKDSGKADDLNNVVSDSINNLRASIEPIQDVVNEMISLYGGTAVANSGVFNKDRGSLSLNSDVDDSYARNIPASNYSEISDMLIGLGDQLAKVDKKPARQKGSMSMSDAGSSSNVDNISTGMNYTNRLLEEWNQTSTSKIADGIRAAFTNDRPDSVIEALRTINKERQTTGKSDTLTALVDNIHTQLVDNNLSLELDEVIDILKAMAINGIPSLAGGDEKERMGYFGQFGRSSSVLGNKVVKMAKGGLGKAKSLAGLATSKLPTRSELWSRIMSGRDTVRDGFNSFKDAVMGVADVRDKDGNIVLLGRKLKAGGYFDKDGKIIRTLNDIKGAVYDADGIVLTEEDVRAKIDEFTYYTKKGWKSLSERVGRLGGRVLGGALGIQQAAFLKMTELGKGVVNHVVTSKDIYIKGEASPRLQRILMLKGFYIDRNSGKLIKAAHDITGPVLNKFKETVISQEEFDNPDTKFVDVDGNPFKTLLGTVRARFTNVVNVAKKYGIKAKDAVVKGGKWAAAKMAGVYGGVKAKIGNGISISATVAKGTNNRLDKIYKLLDDRLPGKRKVVKGDIDGDGLREGGFRETFKRRAEERARKAAEKATLKRQKAKGKDGASKEDGSGILSGLFGSVSGLVSGAISMLGGVMATGFATKALSLMSDGLGSLMSKLNPFSKGDTPDPFDLDGKEGKAKAKTAGGAKGAKKPGLFKSAGKMALKAGGFIGRQVLWQGARMAGGLALGAVSTLSAPVVLGAAAVAAVGYGAYKLATHVTVGALMKYRLAQYGTHEYSDGSEDESKKILYLEGIALKHVAYNDQGISTVKGLDKDIVNSVAKHFGVDMENTNSLERFERWLYGRFLPIFLLWTTRARQTTPGVALQALDDSSKVEPELMLKLLETVKLPVSHPAFRVLGSPFGEKGMIGSMLSIFSSSDLMTGVEVEEVYASTLKTLNGLLSGTKLRRDRKPTDAMESATSATSWYKAANNEVSRGPDGSVTVRGRTFVSEESYIQAKKEAELREELSTGDINTTQTISNVRKARDTGNLNAVEAVRVKAYGLITLQPDKIAKLWSLEESVYKDVIVSGRIASYKGDVLALLNKHISQFGLDASNASDRGVWKTWFESRFLPVFLQYIGTLKSLAPGADPLYAIVSASTPYMLDVAEAIVASRTIYNGREVSVWEVALSPFVDMSSLNTASSSTTGNIMFLKDNMKKAKALEESKGDLDKITINTTAAKAPTARTAPQSKSDMFASDILSQIRTPSAAPRVPMGPMSDGMDKKGGLYSQLNLMGNDKASVAALIKQVAKATGVDENLLLTVAMLESSMNPMANAGTSSAQGLYQFTKGTWAEELKKHGNKYGIPATADPMDPVANALLGAEYLRSGLKNVARAMPTGAEPGPADIYMSHFLGPSGATKFLKNLYANPDRIAAQDFQAAAAANAGVFTDKGRLLSYREMYEGLQKKASNRFSYVAQYSSNPTPPISSVAANSSMPAGMSKIASTVGTDQGRMAITQVKASSDVNRMLDRQKGFESVNVAGGGQGSTTNAVFKDVMKTAATKSVEVGGVNTYVESVKDDVDRRTKAIKQQQQDQKNGWAEQHLTSTLNSEKVLSKQLTVLEAISLSLRQINDKVQFKGTDREAKQLERNHIAERQAAPSIVHERGPINVSRQA